jgi:hypothetical protein
MVSRAQTETAQMPQPNVTSKILEKSVANENMSIEQIGRVANRVAANHVFNDYI